MSEPNERLAEIMDNHTDEGDWFKVWPDERFTIRASSAATKGRYVTLESVAAEDAGPPLHIHHNEDEHFIILEGSVRFRRGNESLLLHAGETATVPRGVVHTWRACSDSPVRMLITFAPSGFEQAFLSLVGAPASDAAAILEQHGCTIEGGKIE